MMVRSDVFLPFLLILPIALHATATNGPVDDVQRTERPRIAITIDDLPWLGSPAPGESRAAATRRLLARLTERGVHATGFVVCDRIKPAAPLLPLWLESGMELGSHTESHRNLNDADLETWLADVRSCDRTLRRLTGGPVRFFRYPYLHQGPTRERRSAALSVLGQLGYQIAHVSVDNSEWVLRRPYEEALRAADEGTRRRIGTLFVEHMLDAVEHYQDFAKRKFGRDVDHVLLLHANILVTDHLGVLLDSLGARGFEFVRLEEALRDPVYARPDDYVGPDGLSWLYRARPATPEGAAWDHRHEASLRDAVRERE
jgi:peptidoglycan/xylan/chitin deacetylase (PgdA/CDA1 family)